MQNINTYIIEKLNKINSKNSISISHKYFPKDKKELEQIISDLMEERGNDGSPRYKEPLSE